MLPNRLMKLLSLKKQVQITYHIHLFNFTIMTLLNARIKSTQELFQVQTSTSMLMQVKKFKKCSRIIGLIRGLSINPHQNVLLTIYKSFVRPHLGYGDILYDKPYNGNFQNKLEKVQYKTCLENQGTSTTKLYDELGLHSLIKRG